MLEAILTNPSAPKAGPAPAATATPAPAVARAAAPPAPVAATKPAVRKAATPKGPGVPVTTLDRFEQAMQLARLAARQGMPALSLRAVRDTLRGGPPVVPMEMTNNRRAAVVISRNNVAQDAAQDQRVRTSVERALAELDKLWQAKKAAPAEVAEVLMQVVLPDTRPAEVFPYPIALAGNTEHPRSAGELLVGWAVRAGKADDLRKRVEARRSQPLAEVPAQVLLGQVARGLADNASTQTALGNLARRLEKDKLQTTAELACLVALPSLADPATEGPALAVVEAATKSLSGTNTSEPAESLHIALARHQLKAGRAEEGAKQLREALALGERVAAMGQRDNPAARRQVYRKIAAEFARAGQWLDALEILGQYADVPAGSYYNAEAGAHPIALVARRLVALPAKERYERLKAWTLPTAGRKSVRVVAAFVPEDAPPEPFGKFPNAADRGVASTAQILIDAAREAGRLDELAAELAKAAEQKTENAAELLVLTQLALGREADAEPKLRALLEEWSKLKEGNPNPWAGAAKDWWPSYLELRAALARPTLADLGHRLARKFPNTYWDFSFSPHLTRDLAVADVAREGAPGVAAGVDPGLALWVPADLLTASQHQMGAVPSWWSAHQGHIHHKVGGGMANPYIYDPEARSPAPGPDSLVFRYPLAGRFEFSVEVHGPSGDLGYGGLAVQPGTGGTQMTWRNGTSTPVPVSKMISVGGAETIPKLCRSVSADGYNRLTVRVEPGKVTYLVNGLTYYEDADPSPTAPWLALFAGPSGPTDLRNATLAGTPEVPREVRLTHADRLEGWLPNFYAETQPTRRAKDATGRAFKTLVASATADDERDWSAKDGEIRGRRLASAAGSEASQSRLTYQRPLLPGESIAYEFFYEPDVTVVHPALGRLAFLLEPGGVRLHWMTDGPDGDWTGLTPGNAVDDSSGRRGPDRLPLKEGDWNTLTLSLDGRVVGIELNGVRVYERDLAPAVGRLFSLYHDKGRSMARVRSVVLRGDWPAPTTTTDLAALRAPGAPPERHARGTLIGDAYLGRDARPLLDRARALPADRRYDLLADWVLPGDDHSGFRLSAEFTPADPVPSGEAPTAGMPEGARRVQAGGELASPALALVASAKEAGKLDALADRVGRAEPRDDLDRRGRLALLAAIELARGRDAEADGHFEALKPLLEKVATDTPEAERWPELVALAATLAPGRPRPTEPARALARVLVPEETEKSGNPALDELPYWMRSSLGSALGATWRRQAAHLAALVEGPSPEGPDGRDPLEGWAEVVHTRASSRGAGSPPGRWAAVGEGELIHVPGHDRDFLYVRTPLRGDFTLTSELVGPRPAQFSYGGVTVGLGKDGKELAVSRLGLQPRQVRINPPLELKKDAPLKFRLSVQDGSFALAINDRKVYEEGLPSEPDPWLALFQPATERGGVRRLKLDGRPTVPDRVALSALPDLTGWSPDCYNESTAGEEPAWEKRGEEVFGRRFKDLSGARVESLLQYHRPMLEDGEIRYEFYYEPGRALVHPSLGRLALLLDPEGVKLHWLTDAPYDRTGLRPDNVAVEKENRRGPDRLPLKEKAWNAVALGVSGDKLTLSLNGTTVYERPLEPTNSRVFGLFHDPGEHEARARNVTYQGAWPRRLPAALAPAIEAAANGR
jgi:hypothetical protein